VVLKTGMIENHPGLFVDKRLSPIFRSFPACNLREECGEFGCSGDLRALEFFKIRSAG
jgi:hypothetical protein